MEKQELYLLWTSRDRDVALKMVFMYGYNSILNKWWDEITLIIWGPSGLLTVDDVEIKNRIKEMLKAGVKVIACKACADQYGISDQMISLGIEVIYMGEPLTELLKSGKKVLTF